MMATRTESAAATRRALLDAAGALLDTGGPEAVTLREVGARAGVSRSAPYGHFANKDSLLMALAAETWDSVGDALEELAARLDSPPSTLRHALISLITLGRARPHLYRLMFTTTPAADPTAAMQAAGRAQDLFLAIVSRVVGPDRSRQDAALLLTNAHGITSLELSGHLTFDKWQTTAEDLVERLIGLLPQHP
ncbi:MAG: TetR family transcriptional regulator [Amycolatopsis sp.]|jgi:AcrR family transcriptional regulator|nr:TetR family transcriptional regulator [Amycolatopsis sp.]